MIEGISPLWFFVFAGLQGAVLLVDEVVFHWRRGLPRWERWGHPVDTFFFALPLTVNWLWPDARGAYWALAVLSCLIITKDERHHAELAGGGEQWLHALLFLLHPVVLILATAPGVRETAAYPWLLAAVAAFGLYQILYWNVFEPRQSRAR